MTDLVLSYPFTFYLLVFPRAFSAREKGCVRWANSSTDPKPGLPGKPHRSCRRWRQPWWEPAGLPGRSPWAQVLGAALKLLLGAAEDQVPVYFTAESTHAFPGAIVQLPCRGGGEESFDGSSLSLPHR